MTIHSLTFPTGRAIFCDDIRMELGNKTTLVGIYNGDMVFPSEVKFPALLPKLGIAIYWSEPVDGCSRSISFQASLVSVEAKPEEAGTLLAQSKHEISEETIAHTASEHSRTSVPMTNGIATYLMVSPLQISAPCKIRVRAIRDDGEWMVGAMRISVAQANPE